MRIVLKIKNFNNIELQTRFGVVECTCPIKGAPKELDVPNAEALKTLADIDLLDICSREEEEIIH